MPRTTSQPARHTIHATSIAVQRKRQMPRSCSRMKSTAAFIYLENRLWYDQHVARFQRNVLLHIAAVDQVCQLHVQRYLLSVYRTHDASAVAGGKLGQAADGEDRIEHRHTFAIG